MVNKLLFALSKSEWFCGAVLKFSSMRKFSKRFVAGHRLPQAIAAAKILKRQNILATFDYLGETVKSKQEVRGAINEYLKIINEIQNHKLNAHVAIKLSQVGLSINTKYCEENVEEILALAKRKKVFVEFDAEQAIYTTDTQDIVLRMKKKYNIGIAIQANLKRTKHDLKRLMKKKIFIRLVKGAYLEHASVAFSEKIDVDKNFVTLMKMAEGKTPIALGTHDEKIITLSKSMNITEYQMLYGIKTKKQQMLSKDQIMRVYLPYGVEWCPYFMRRLAERPTTIWFLLKNLFT